MKLQDLIEKHGGEGSPHAQRNGSTPGRRIAETGFETHREDAHQMMVDEVDSSFLDERPKNGQREILEETAEEIVAEVTSRHGISLTRREREQEVQSLVNNVIGFGPLEPLLDRDDINEIMVNGPDQVMIEQEGTMAETDVQFRDEDHLLNVIDRIVSPLGRRIDESQPYVDARLPDGSRVNVIIPPLVLQGPTVTIRKFAEDPYTIRDLQNFGTLTAEMAEFLEACVLAKKNVLVSGGTGAGKTTTLNCLSAFIPNDERIVSIEDSVELQLQQDHIVQCETRSANVEDAGEVSTRDLVRNSLRMRPDRIIVGECRGGEAFDMLQAMNTGHEGSLTTIHANNPRSTLSRLANLVVMAGMELPEWSVREQIASALDVIVQQNRFHDGSRRITSISEVDGLESGTIQMSEIFRYEREGVRDGVIQGAHRPTGVRPSFFEEMEERGISVNEEMFVA